LTMEPGAVGSGSLGMVGEASIAARRPEGSPVVGPADCGKFRV
jgi:hypothetical protein